MREAVIQRHIIDYLNSQNIYNFKIIAANKKGIPDIFCMYKGKTIFLEVKIPRKNASKLQEYQLSSLKENGAITAVVRSVDDVKNVIDNLNDDVDMSIRLLK